MKSINIVDYDPQWPKQFQELKSIYSKALASNFISIEHVGSTAVPGLAAKPILDIDIIVADETYLNKVIPMITSLGYLFMGDQGIAERYAFQPVSDLSPDIHAGILRAKHHLYCCLEGSVSLFNHLLFREALRNDDSLAKQYGDLKKELALTTTDMDVYVEAKSGFIADVLRRVGLSDNHIEDIVVQNKKK